MSRMHRYDIGMAPQKSCLVSYIYIVYVTLNSFLKPQILTKFTTNPLTIAHCLLHGGIKGTAPASYSHNARLDLQCIYDLVLLRSLTHTVSVAPGRVV